MLLGILTEGGAGLKPGTLDLDETQRSLWRAGHAHAGVYVILSLILQPLVDQTALSNAIKWVARLAASMLVAGLGLLKNLRPQTV
jgi:drug/metabolite transporter superfamily protein YnfA